LHDFAFAQQTAELLQLCHQIVPMLALVDLGVHHSINHLVAPSQSHDPPREYGGRQCYRNQILVGARRTHYPDLERNPSTRSICSEFVPGPLAAMGQALGALG
jgi:hypothetical protein